MPKPNFSGTPKFTPGTRVIYGFGGQYSEAVIESIDELSLITSGEPRYFFEPKDSTGETKRYSYPESHITHYFDGDTKIQVREPEDNPGLIRW